MRSLPAQASPVSFDQAAKAVASAKADVDLAYRIGAEEAPRRPSTPTRSTAELEFVDVLSEYIRNAVGSKLYDGVSNAIRCTP
jgi:hypothetical protein